jgi:hypothetical protein
LLSWEEELVVPLIAASASELAEKPHEITTKERKSRRVLSRDFLKDKFLRRIVTGPKNPSAT